MLRMAEGSRNWTYSIWMFFVDSDVLEVFFKSKIGDREGPLVAASYRCPIEQKWVVGAPNTATD